MSLQQFLRLAAPPQKPVETAPRKGWGKIEKRLGIQFPPDYKSFVDLYGTGTINNLIHIYNPFSTTEFNLLDILDTHHRAGEQIRLKGDSAWTVVHPFDLYPAREGLIPWGTTTQFGLVFFWKTVGPAEDWETIFYDLKTGEYEVWKLPCIELLFRLLAREIDSVLLPEDFFLQTESITFYSHSPERI